MKTFSNGEKRLRHVSTIAHLVFGLTTLAFGFAFHRNVANSFVGYFKYASVAVTVWASFHGAFDFAIHQAKGCAPWLCGANLTFLGASMLSCLLGMALSQSEFLYNGTVAAALILYIAWDIIAIHYYRTHSSFWRQEHETLLTGDIVVLATFLLSLTPLIGLYIDPGLA